MRVAPLALAWILAPALLAGGAASPFAAAAPAASPDRSLDLARALIRLVDQPARYQLELRALGALAEVAPNLGRLKGRAGVQHHEDFHLDLSFPQLHPRARVALSTGPEGRFLRVVVPEVLEGGGHDVAMDLGARRKPRPGPPRPPDAERLARDLRRFGVLVRDHPVPVGRALRCLLPLPGLTAQVYLGPEGRPRRVLAHQGQAAILDLRLELDRAARFPRPRLGAPREVEGAELFALLTVLAAGHRVVEVGAPRPAAPETRPEASSPTEPSWLRGQEDRR